jgi:hypothetical protein
MVYLAADNNLEGSAIDDFLEMSNVGSDDNINIIVQLDRINGYDSRYGDWTICHRFYVTQNMLPYENRAISDWGDGKGGGREVNMGNKETLTDFVRWGGRKLPCRKICNNFMEPRKRVEEFTRRKTNLSFQRDMLG